jgi:AraC-like DNA-binding protein
MIVEIEMERLGFHCRSIEIGKIDVIEEITPEDLIKIQTALFRCGLELLDNKKRRLVEKIKSTLIEMIHYSDKQVKLNFSKYLSSKLNHDYTYLANVFSEIESTTIENFIIRHRIQTAKDLIAHSELNLTEISWKLNYSSVAHLSTQFKKVTGVTPSYFKHSTIQSLEKCEL